MRILFLILLAAVASAVCFGDESKLPRQEKTNTKQVEKTVQFTPGGEAHKPSIWMKQKLKHSQKIFAGMVEGDLFAVEESARILKFTSRLENFVKARHKGYRAQLKDFQVANNKILKGAKEKDIDKVTLAYNQMTVSCVACHKQLRAGDSHKE